MIDRGSFYWIGSAALCVHWSLSTNDYLRRRRASFKAALTIKVEPNSNENHEETSLAADNSIESLLILSDYDEKALIPSTILNEIMLHEFLRATPKTNANKLESMQQTAEKKPN